MRSRNWRLVTVLALAGLLAGTEVALARGRGNSAAAARAQRQAMINNLQMQLAQAQQALSAAQMAISDAEGQVNSANDRIQGARQSIADAKSGALESTKSQKSIEAEILAAQEDGSDYAKANLAFLEAQEEVKAAQERIYSSESYLTQKTIILKEPSHAAKLAKLQHDALADDIGYTTAFEKLKAAKAVINHVKMDLFKANAEWVAATAASKDAQTEETKANSEATRGAFKKLPAMRNLREAQAAADEAREAVATIQYQLKLLGAQPKTTPASTSASARK